MVSVLGNAKVRPGGELFRKDKLIGKWLCFNVIVLECQANLEMVDYPRLVHSRCLHNLTSLTQLLEALRRGEPKSTNDVVGLDFLMLQLAVEQLELESRRLFARKIGVTSGNEDCTI
jgi:hypothetical protein